MIMLSSGMSTFKNVAEFIALLVIFVLIIILAYLITRWIGNIQSVQNKDKNIKVLEVYKISPNKLIEIVKIGNKYIVVGICKDSIEFLTELKEDEFTLPAEPVVVPDFKDILSKLNKGNKQK